MTLAPGVREAGSRTVPGLPGVLQTTEDGGRRRGILVQLPEPLSEGEFDTIAAITRDPARQAGV